MAILTRFFRTRLGSRFVEFLRTERGKALDKLLVRYLNYSVLMLAFSRRAGFPYIPVLLLHTVGSKSGQARSAVMPYILYQGRIYLIGANGAKPYDPGWVHNLKAQPRAKITLDRRDAEVVARVLPWESDERARVWACAATKTPQYQIYQNATDRQVPVVALDRV